MMDQKFKPVKDYVDTIPKKVRLELLVKLNDKLVDQFENELQNLLVLDLGLRCDPNNTQIKKNMIHCYKECLMYQGNLEVIQKEIENLTNLKGVEKIKKNKVISFEQFKNRK